jgi:hypothetical protein
MTAPHDGVTPEPEQSGATTAAGPIASQTRRHSIVLAAALIVALAVLVAAAFVVTSTSGMKEVQRQQSEAAKIALSLSVNQLHAVALRNVPFSAELALVRTVAGADSATARDLAIIEPMQHEGLPAPKRIVTDFEQAAATVLIAERTGPQPGWFAQVVGRVSAITVALGMELNWNPLGSAAAPVIKAAADALRIGDLAEAARRVDMLPDPAQTIFAPWRSLVQRRIDAIAAIERLVQRATTERVASRAVDATEGEGR